MLRDIIIISNIFKQRGPFVELHTIFPRIHVQTIIMKFLRTAHTLLPELLLKHKHFPENKPLPKLHYS